MKTIDSISLSRMTNSTHDAFMTEVSNRAAANEKVSVQAAATVFIKKVAKENELIKISQRNELTAPIDDADELRDRLYIGYKSIVKGYTYMPEDDETHTAAAKLQQHIDDYKISTKDQYDRETSDIGNFITDLEAKFTAETATIGLTAVVAKLKAANDTVRTLLQQRDDQGPAIEEGALAAAREATDAAYASLTDRVAALNLVEGDDLYEQFIDETNRQIARIKTQTKAKTKKTDDTTPDTTTPDTTDATQE